MLALIRNDINYLGKLFVKYLNNFEPSVFLDIEKYIELVYESEFCDIDDLGNCVHVINYFIKYQITRNKPCVPLVNLRKKTNKLVKLKYYQGHDLMYQKDILKNIKKAKLESNNLIYKYKNYFNCEEDFRIYKKIIWKPSVIELSNLGRPIDFY